MKEKILEQIDTIPTKQTDSLTIFNYERQQSEETAFLIAGVQSEQKTMVNFILTAFKKLNQLQFIEDEYVKNCLQSAIFLNLEKQELNKQLLHVPFKLTTPVIEEIKLFKSGYKIQEHWNLKIYAIETKTMFLCYAWQTTA